MSYCFGTVLSGPIRELFLSSPEEDWEWLFPWEVFMDTLPRSPVFSQEGWVRKIWLIFLEFIYVTHAVGRDTLCCNLLLRY